MGTKSQLVEVKAKSAATTQEWKKFANTVRVVDLRFTDLFGTWNHITIPASRMDETLFTHGIGFDGSSLRGWQAIHESDMLLRADPTSGFVDPFTTEPQATFVAEVFHPLTHEAYSRDPRGVAKRAEAYLKQSAIADTAYMGPELEFFIFDNVRYDQNQHEGYYHIDSDEGVWNTGLNGDHRNLGYKVKNKMGYLPVANDTYQNVRNEMMLTLQKCGITTEVHHHEVATAGQGEIGMQFQSLTRMADQVQMYKYVLRSVARRHGKTVTFMPKPLFQDNGTGMHTHQSLWKSGENLFYDPNGYGRISKLTKHYIAGILNHAPALMAICAPTTNSYKRLVPGYEAPVNLVYSARNRSAGIRIPIVGATGKLVRIEFRCPDATCNPYLAFAGMLMAGLDGIKKKMDPGEPFDHDLFELTPEEAKKVPTVPGSLEGSLSALEGDHRFLTEGGVFTKDLIETYIDFKRKNDVDAIRMRPHPYEFFLYFDA